VTEAASSDFKGTGAQWFGVLAAPTAWSLQILIGYNLEDFLCAPASDSQAFLGMSIGAALTVIHALLVALSLAGGLVALRGWRKENDNGSIGGRAKWMSLAGILVTVMFLIPVVLGFAPAAYLNVCDPPL
jgi:hypothetical protein